MLFHFCNSILQRKTILFLLICTLIYACNISSDQSSRDKNKIIITGVGETQHPKKTLFLKTQLGGIRQKINNKKFHFELENEETSIVQFSIAMYLNFPILVKPGDSIHIEFNEIDLMNEMNPPTFSGSREIENSYLFQLNQILKYRNTSYNYFYNCNETIFFAKIDSLKHLGKNIISKYTEEQNQDPEVEKLMEDFLNYNLAYYVESYHHKLKFSFAEEIKKKSERFLSYQKNLISDDSLILNNIAYSSFLEKKFFNEITNQISLEGEKIEKKRWPDYSVNEQFEFTELAFEEKRTKDFLRFKTLYNKIHTLGVISQNDIRQFENTHPNPKYLQVIKNEFSQLPITLQNDTTLPNYTFIDRNEQEVNLYDFQGKILYVDLWATWCGPCASERPYFEALMKDFASNQDDITFLGISIDRESDKEKWKEFINRRKYEGVQLMVENAFESQICQDLKVQTIPRFFIVGRDSKLIQSKALRPSQKELKKILEDLILES